MFEWSDLSYFLAVAEHGSTIAAASKLGVNQSTVQRRIAALKRAIGQRLIERHASGYRLTDFGRELLPLCVDVKGAMQAVERRVASHASGVAGVIRLTCPEPLAERLKKSELLQAFHGKHPKLRVELLMSDRYLDLTKGEADVALRSGEPADEKLFGRKVADSIWAVYASQSYVQKHGAPHSIDDMPQHAVVAYDGALSQHRAAQWLAKVAPNAKVVARSGSVLGILHAVRSGMGVSPLPTTIAAMHGELTQVLPPIDELRRGWYLLTTPELRQTPHVAALFNFVIDHLNLMRPVLMG